MGKIRFKSSIWATVSGLNVSSSVLGVGFSATFTNSSLERLKKGIKLSITAFAGLSGNSSD